MWRDIVLDAAPLLDSDYVLPSNSSGEPLTFFTIPEVLAEIKDEQSRQRLERFKAVHTLHIAQPTQKAVQLVVQFAKRSGDLQVLSRADLRLIALTVTRMQAHGVPTRPLPSGAQVHQGTTTPKQPAPTKEEEEQEEEKSLPQERTAHVPSAPSSVKRLSELDRISECEEPAASLSETEEMDNALAAALEECHIVEEECGQVDQTEVQEDLSNMEADGFVKVSHRKQNKRVPMRQMAPEEGWITPDNLAKMKTRHASVKNAPKVKEAEEVVHHPVAVITGDFAMQNILLQLGAHLLAKDGQRITQIRQYVLRCHACTKITKQMDKQFCPSCGNPTLMRTSCSVNEDGSLHLYLKKGFQYHLRGTKFNIAQITGGPNASVPILREDQKEYEQAARIANRVRKDMLQAEEDPSLFGGEHYRGKLYAQKGIQSKVNLKTGRVIIGSGSRDPNRRRRKV